MPLGTLMACEHLESFVTDEPSPNKSAFEAMRHPSGVREFDTGRQRTLRRARARRAFRPS